MTDTDQWDCLPGPPTVREQLLELARPHVGLSFSEPTRERYVQALFDDEPSLRAYEMARTMSSCGLFVRACWRRFGLSDRRVVAPYVPGAVMADLSEMAREAGAWRSARDLDQVQPGDAVFLGDPDHVLIVEAVVMQDGADAGLELIRSIDGGQRDAAHQWMIGRHVRRVGAGPALDGRPVTGWVDWAAVAERFAG